VHHWRRISSSRTTDDDAGRTVLDDSPDVGFVIASWTTPSLRRDRLNDDGEPQIVVHVSNVLFRSKDEGTLGAKTAITNTKKR
jgi:hypothetical protein